MIRTLYAFIASALLFSTACFAQTSGEGNYGGGGTGTVTNVSSANSRASVANQTTTPVITINSAPNADTTVAKIPFAQLGGFPTNTQIVAGVGITYNQANGHLGGTDTTSIDLRINAKEPTITPSNVVKQYWNGFKQFVGGNSDSLIEGAINQFFTNARARGAVSVAGYLTYNSATGVFALDTTAGHAATKTDLNSYPLTSTLKQGAYFSDTTLVVRNTRNINTTSPITGGGNLSADRTIAINNAVADGATKGAASFTAADFNDASGNISLDYTNGQKASASVPGFLSSADWSTFNSKQGTISVNSPITLAGSTIGLDTSAGKAATKTDLASYFKISNNLSEGTASTMRTNLGLATIAASGSASDLSSGTLPAGRFPALTGDITTSAGALATTLKNTGTAGTYGSATQVPQLTFDAQGRETGNSNVTITPAYSSLTGVPSTFNAVMANPTASLGLSTINGSATTAMRSDAAPALDQTISPYWTGTHKFTQPVSVYNTLQAVIKDSGGQVANVKAFGALGDGSTDDHVAIQAAINSSPQKTIYFPPGIYSIGTTTLTIPTFTILAGSSDSTTIKYAGSGDAITISEKKHVAIRDLCFDLSGTRSGAIGVHVKGLWFGDFSNLKFKGSDSVNSHIKIETSSTGGDNFGAYIIHITNVDIGVNATKGANGIRAVRTVGDANKVTMLTITGGWIEAVGTGIYLSNVTDFDIRGTTIEDCTSDAIYADSSASLVLMQRELTGNAGYGINFGTGMTGEAQVLFPSYSNSTWGTLGNINRANYDPIVIQRDSVLMGRMFTANTAGNNGVFMAQGAAIGATNKNGGTGIISGGKSTGTGTSVVQIMTTPAGSSGTADNTPVVKGTVNSKGYARFGDATNPTTILQTAADSLFSSLWINIAYGAGNTPTFIGASARGTEASPTTTLSGDLLARFAGSGTPTSTPDGSTKASIDMYATQNWGSSARGTKMDFNTTPNNSTTLTFAGRFDQDGSFQVGSSSQLQVSSSGVDVKRNGVTMPSTEHWQYTPIADTVSRTGQTATIGATNLNNTATNGLYRIAVYMYTTTAGVSGSATATISWNDGSAQTNTSSTLTFGVLGSEVQFNTLCRVTNSTAITWATAISSPIGSPVYEIDVFAERLW